jgi:hypothetical protein
MDAKALSEIPLREYPNLSDEILNEIIAYYGQTYDNNAQGFVYAKYKFAYDLMVLRFNKNLVKETARLAKRTWYLAITTIIVAVGTVALALISLTGN